MRTGYRTKPYEKHMEVFQNFTGGLNTVSPPDGMTDTELLDMMNQDISERGSLKRRHGMRYVRDIPFSGNVQGYFRYYKADGTYDELYMRTGYIYRNDEPNLLRINGEMIQLQTKRQAEAAQFGGMLYIATGTKLLQYDGTDLKVVEPYAPSTMEMTYIGANILADDPEGHLHDTVGLVASIDYVLPKLFRFNSKMYVNAKVFCTKIDGEEYQFALQVRGTDKKSEDWQAIEDLQWMRLNTTNLLGYGPVELLLSMKYGAIASPGDYEIKISMRKKDDTTEILSECLVPYTVPATIEPDKTALYTIHQCNRIFSHWGRMMLYGDPDQPALLYMSHLNTPNYFPALLNLQFESPKREPLTTIVHYRNSLVVFTKSSTQALYGTGPDDYRRVMLHTDLGCIAPFGAAVMKNHIGFVSLQGIYALKTMGLTDDKATVEKLDLKIDNIVPKDDNALVIFNDGQLQVTYPNQKTRFRFYSELGAWTKDYSEKFDFIRQYNIDGEIFSLRSDGVYVFDESVYTDGDYIYTNYWECKYLNFGQPYHQKKLKELQVLTSPDDEELNCTVYVYADEQAVITPDSSYASIVDGAVVWNVKIEPNFHVAGGSTFDDKWVLGDSVLGKNVFAVNKLRLTGKCLRTRLRVINDEPKENHFMGFAYIFKVKKA